MSIKFDKEKQQTKKMLFVLPPSSEEGRRLNPSHHPIMTATMVGVARKNGARVKVIDAVVGGNSYQNILEQIQEFQPNWLGVMPFEYRREMELSPILNFVKFLKNKKPRIEI